MVGWPFENDVYPQGYLLAGEEAERALQVDTHVRGLTSWGCNRGPTVIHYFGRHPYAADNVLLPDGSRGKIRAIEIASLPATWRRPLNDPGGRWLANSINVPVLWRWGTLTILDDDLVFVDAQKPLCHAFSAHSEPLERDLLADAEIQKFVMDPLAAHATLWMIFKGDWLHPERKAEAFFTIDEAAYIICSLRGLGEHFRDWLTYCLHDKRDYSHYYEPAREHLMRLGWIDERR
ncbi:hypothetical protein [Rhizobium sp. RU36D]|uniref:hypothetical protein n=1 Tax=Rhizobium sp. RU36D TaxID=1907415 RepID=UPI0009D7B777|nr:hypothetical protein [Rhizobium sp. RU36D]SMD00119.1 hypothetical protein SAMN05880593_11494 [Rhizobium sp. RU36D]